MSDKTITIHFSLKYLEKTAGALLDDYPYIGELVQDALREHARSQEINKLAEELRSYELRCGLTEVAERLYRQGVTTLDINPDGSEVEDFDK